VLAACATTPREMTFLSPAVESPGTVSWPAAPTLPRLEYVGQLTGEANFSSTGAESTGGRILRWIAGLGKGRRQVTQLLRPQTGMVDSKGRILVTDAGIPGVMVFDASEATLSLWRDATAHQPFVSPVGIGETRSGSIVVADSSLGILVVLSTEGEPSGEIRHSSLERPTGVAVDRATGRIFVADSKADNIKVFDEAGRYIQSIGQPGTGRGQFNGPTHIAYASDSLYVTDTLNARVQVIGDDGFSDTDIGQRGLYVGNLVRPKGITTDGDGNIYVIESYFDHLLIYDDTGRLLLPVGGSGSGVGRFFLPSGAWSDDSDRIFVADMFNGRVVVMQYLGD